MDSKIKPWGKKLQDVHKPIPFEVRELSDYPLSISKKGKKNWKGSQAEQEAGRESGGLSQAYGDRIISIGGFVKNVLR